MREWPPLTPKRTQGALPLDLAIARFGLEELLSLRNRVSAVFCCDTIWLAPIIRCRSAHLVEVQPNFCLLWICTILLMPAKAALLRSPHFNRKTTASAVVFVLFISSFQKIIDADAIKISERAQNVRRQHSFAAFIICVCALRNVDRFADLTLCQIGILPQIADAPVSLHVYHQTQYT